VTVVETAKGLQTGGSPVDIKDRAVDIVKRIGSLEQIYAKSLKAKAINFLDTDGVSLATIPAPGGEAGDAAPEFEVERGTLLQMMFEAMKGDAAFLFDDRITL
jgi:2-polyprenyl-6-methoxyphenol hydroxylase-like FAD-dependent oxidoreductase